MIDYETLFKIISLMVQFAALLFLINAARKL